MEEVRDFQVIDDTHGTFTIGCPMATFNVDKQNDLKQLSQVSLKDVCRPDLQTLDPGSCRHCSAHLAVHAYIPTN